MSSLNNQVMCRLIMKSQSRQTEDINTEARHELNTIKGGRPHGAELPQATAVMEPCAAEK